MRDRAGTDGTVPPMSRRLPALFAIALFSCSSAPPKPAETTLASGRTTLAVSADARTLTLRRGPTTLLTFPADAFQLGTVAAFDPHASYDPYWLEAQDPLNQKPPDDLEWREASAAKVVSATATGLALDLTYPGATARLTVDVDAPGRFTAKLVPNVTDGTVVAWLRLRPRADATEGFYGLGEWGDTLNHRGHLRPMQMEVDLSLESANLENHAPIPLLIGTRGWGLFVESRRPGLFDVARKAADLVEVTFGTAADSAAGLTFDLISEENPLDVTRHYFERSGAPTLPAPWALGPWIWRNENRDQAQVLDDLEQIRSLDLATSAMWLDRPYATGVNTFDFDAAKFPDAPAMIRAVHDAGLRMALWHVPYVDATTGELQRTALANGYYPPQSGLLLNHGWGKPLDFTNPDAFAWWQGLVRRYTDAGIEGFKLDFAEDVQLGLYGSRNEWRFHDGSDERTMHHGYQLLYHQVYRETLPETGGFLLCRTARWGDQRNVSVVWPGDLDANLKRFGEQREDGRRYVGGLPASVILGLGLGPSGFAFYGADTGGYQHGPPDNETFTRWFEQTALSTVMQVGDSSSQTPWEFTAENGRDATTLDTYRRYARLHLRLFPYEWTYAQRLPRDGRALMRPVGLAYPALGEHPDDEYLFGDDLLVAPVVEAGKTTKSVLFPPGTWIDWFSGTSHEGGARAEVAAPLDTLPLFLRAGAIIPLLRPTIDTLSPTTRGGVESYANDAGPLTVRLAPDATATSFTLYDGTRVSQQRVDAATTIDVAPGTTFTKGAVLEVIRSGATAVTAGDAALAKVTTESALEAAATGWRTDDAMGGTVWVKLPPGAAHVTIR
jgi:alpha-D-xyloside xylohydrolase